ncbi:MAG: 2'-5' RNA ligase family protein [Candidatus Gracilibacteria bacterium]|jgi:2'-5' RNA ligase
MQIGYGIILGGEINNFMREVELLLFNKFNLRKGLYQPPHITIKPPFEVEELSSYKNYLDELCGKIKAFEVELKGFNSFGKKVIYLDVKNNQKLYDIYEIIFGDIKNKCNPKLIKDDMIFHATLAYDDIDEETFDKAYKYLKTNYQPEFRFTIDKIGLFYQLPGDSGWIVIKEKSLNI